MLLNKAKSELSAHGVSLKKQDGEYRVTLKGLSGERAEAVAYYTNDIVDAYNTGRQMALDKAKA